MSEPFSVTDKRHRRSGAPTAPTGGGGLITGESVAEAKSAAATGRMPRSGIRMHGVGDTNRLSNNGGAGTDDVLTEMRRNRRIAMKKQGAAAPGQGAADISFATGRPRDPMFYWRQNNVPFDVTKEDELRKVREFCRLLYITHPIISACVDIYSKFPLQGMTLTCKDEQLKDFYSSLFFDELNYEDFLLDLGREYWLQGEAWPLGTFNEALGVWEDDELLHPDDVEVERSPFLKEPRFLIRLPKTLRKILTERQPRWEYDKLIKAYPELASYVGDNSLMPVSNVLLKQLRFKADTFHNRGIPILMRGFRAITQEEMLNSSMDAIADRLYTPLILAKLGASAQDLGTDVPWVPTPDDLADFEEALDAALAGDFRVLTHHFATEMETVYGRENMPDMSADFERLEDRILQVFGLSRTMLQGAGQGETYAADALNRDMITQLLSHYQRMIQNFFKERALVVAEAQEHFDYTVRNGQRYIEMEEVLEVDEETGEERIVEQPKLLVPELEFESMTLQDEETERNFTEALAAAGLPVPYRKRIQGTGMNLEDMIEERTQETVDLAVADQEVRRETYRALRDRHLPIPADLQADFAPQAQVDTTGPPQAGPNGQSGGLDQVLPQLGVAPQDNPALAPNQFEVGQQQWESQIESMEANTSQGDEDGEGDGGGQGPVNGAAPSGGGPPSRPPESDEKRREMPKPEQPQPPHFTGSLTSSLSRPGQRITAAARAHHQEPDNSIEDPDRPQDHRPTGRFGPPKHVGMRRHITLHDDERGDEDDGL